MGGLTGIQEGYLSHSYADIDIRAISTASGVEIGGLTGRSENLITECVATGKLFVSSYIAYG